MNKLQCDDNIKLRICSFIPRASFEICIFPLIPFLFSTSRLACDLFLEVSKLTCGNCLVWSFETLLLPSCPQLQTGNEEGGKKRSIRLGRKRGAKRQTIATGIKGILIPSLTIFPSDHSSVTSKYQSLPGHFFIADREPGDCIKDGKVHHTSIPPRHHCFHPCPIK